MISTILSSGLFLHSSMSFSLLFILSSMFFNFSCWILYLRSGFLNIFSSSLLNFSLCKSILFTNLLKIFINNALNSVCGKLFLSLFIFSGFFPCYFNWEQCIFPFIVLNLFSASMNSDETVTYCSLDRVFPCGRITWPAGTRCLWRGTGFEVDTNPSFLTVCC